MISNYEKLTKQILNLDPQIRFVAVVNSKGEILVGGQKENVEQILSDEQANMSIHYALQKRELYTNLVHKIGHEKFSVTEFGKVIMISIPINSNELFLISTEPCTDYLKIINFIHTALESQKDTE